MSSLSDRSRTPPPKGLTFEEFLEWCDSETRAEWVNGEIVLMSPASSRHQRIGSFLEAVLRPYAEARSLGEVFRAPFLMRLAQVPSGREPDLFLVATERLDLVKQTYLDGPADLAVEIVSPESASRDRGKKFVEYELAGVREYWLLDPDRQIAEFYQLGDNGRYQLAVVADGVYHSRIVTGFFLRVDWLWQTPLPKTVDVLRELQVL